jgi:D-alanyl-lipoteichoic acid acyltransferase DltB (MBOAT superfamily)
MPGLVGGYGNYLLPVQCGAPDMAKQKIKNIKFLIINSLIKNYSKINSKTLTNKELNLSYYLAGLIEGDGYISINNKNKVLIAITFNIKDKPLADKLLIILGLGKGFIVKRKTNSIELRFSSIISLKKIINLINGKFRTPKIEQLYKLID